jgi:hypothetical protein
LTIPAMAQNWSGILDPARAVDWSTAGVIGNIPSATWTNCTTTACNTLYGGSVTATTIQNALASCPANTVVRIPAGTFNVAAFNDTQSNCVLRGAGSSQTMLVMTSNQSGAGFGGTDSATIHLMSGANGVGVGPLNGFTAPSQTANWTAGYTQGTTTVITLSNTTGLVAGPVGTGTLLFLDQTDDSSDGWPATGDLYVCANASNNCSNKGGGNNYGRQNGSAGSTTVRSQIQVVTVTAVNGSSVTISPAVMYPNIRSGQNPGAYWNTTLPVNNAGIEDMSVDFSGSNTGLFIANAANVWATRMRFVNTDTNVTSQGHFSITIEQSQHVTIRSNYFWGPQGSCSNFPVDNYQNKWGEISNSLVENNIYEAYIGAIFPNDPSGGNVIAYNFAVNGVIGVGGLQPHGGGIEFDLVEGNTWETSYYDVTHGTHFFATSYRNLFNGTESNNSCTVGMAFGLLTNNRFMNAVGNVIGSTSYSAYEADLEAYGGCGSNAVFNLGGAGCNSGTPTTTDSNVKRTLVRWGNWDMFTSTNRTGTNDQTGTRWCGNSSDTGWSTTCSSTSEVPTGITNFSNAVPTVGDTTAGMAALPASFYLSAKPSWFGNVTFPSVGPDVSSGNATNTSTTPSGGHANLIPSRVCYNGLSADSAYSGSSPSVKVFNAATCYASNSPTVVAPATNLFAKAQ